MKKILLLSGLFAFISVTTIEAQQDTSAVKMDPKAATYFNNAVQNLQSQKYEEAVIYADSSLQITKDYKTYLLKGDALVKLNKYAEAKEAFNASLSLNQNDAAYNKIANTQLLLKEYDDAIATYNKILQVSNSEETKKNAQESIAFINNTKAVELFNEGNELSKASKFDEAIKKYDASLVINTNDPKTHFQKGITLSKMEKSDDAEKSFNAAIAADPTFDLAYLALAGLLTKKNDYDGAIKNYEKVIEVSKNPTLVNSAKEGESRTYLVAGNTAIKEKKYDKALDYFTKANEKAGSDQAFLGLAKAYNEKRQYDNALKSLDSTVALKKTVSDGAIAYYRGLIYFNKGDNTKALENFKAGLTDPTYKKACQSQIDFINAKLKGAKSKK
ncbi:MAG: hypothetical protein C4539_12570 [Ignavibacteriales bacterium]|nr:MAG: hypothetical protein C4539_12570 [Ignavibacteriales bacterium]